MKLKKRYRRKTHYTIAAMTPLVCSFFFRRAKFSVTPLICCKCIARQIMCSNVHIWTQSGNLYRNYPHHVILF